MKFTLLYRIAKAVIGRVWLSGLVKKAAEHKSEICEQASAGDGVEVICAIPISSKEEVYDRIPMISQKPSAARVSLTASKSLAAQSLLKTAASSLKAAKASDRERTRLKPS